MHAIRASRMRARARARVPLLTASQMARDLRPSKSRQRALQLQATAPLEELRHSPAQLVRAGASRRGLRGDVRDVARITARRMAGALPRLEGAREARVRRPSHEDREQEAPGRDAWSPLLR